MNKKEYLDLKNNEDLGQMSLIEFQDKIAKLRQVEDTSHMTAHFKGDFNEKELGQEDMEMWNLYELAIADKVSGGEVWKRLNEYRKGISEMNAEEPSRAKFCAYLANMLTPIVTQWQLAKKAATK